jgi:hypothetical protein
VVSIAHENFLVSKDAIKKATDTRCVCGFHFLRFHVMFDKQQAQYGKAGLKNRRKMSSD